MKSEHTYSKTNPHLTTHDGPTSDAGPAEAQISPTLPLATQAKRSSGMSCKVYVKPSCPFSSATVAFLCTYGLGFTVVNVEHHPQEKERVSDMLGDKKFETPTLLLNEQWLVAPTLSELKQHLTTLGIGPQPKPTPR